MGHNLKIGSINAGQIDSSTFKMAPIGPLPEDEEARTTLQMKEGDKVSISAEGLKKSAEEQGKSAKEVAQEVASDDETEEMIRKKIKQLEKELKELRKDPETNEKAIKMKEQELAQYQGMLLEALDKKSGSGGGGGAGGGTRAQTADSSLTETPAGMLAEVRF